MKICIRNRLTGLFLGLVLLLCALPARSRGAAAAAPPAPEEVLPGLSIGWEDLAQGVLTCTAAPGAGPFSIRIAKGDAACLYHLQGAGETARLPLQLGEGPYRMEVFTPAGSGWERRWRRDFELVLARRHGPFLTGNLFVPTDGVADLALQLTGDCRGDRKKAEILYRYVAENIAYDGAKAEGLDGSYRPDPARTLAEGRGICMDYAALLAALCRAAGIPAKLVTGHLTDSGIYHAWNEVYYLGRWHRLDPTLGAEAGPGRNYTAEQVY